MFKLRCTRFKTYGLLGNFEMRKSNHDLYKK